MKIIDACNRYFEEKATVTFPNGTQGLDVEAFEKAGRRRIALIYLVGNIAVPAAIYGFATVSTMIKNQMN